MTVFFLKAKSDCKKIPTNETKLEQKQKNELNEEWLEIVQLRCMMKLE